jgi:hypothetical protein
MAPAFHRKRGKFKPAAGLQAHRLFKNGLKTEVLPLASWSSHNFGLVWGGEGRFIFNASFSAPESHEDGSRVSRVRNPKFVKGKVERTSDRRLAGAETGWRHKPCL